MEVAEDEAEGEAEPLGVGDWLGAIPPVGLNESVGPSEPVGLGVTLRSPVGLADAPASRADEQDDNARALIPIMPRPSRALRRVGSER